MAPAAEVGGLPLGVEGLALVETRLMTAWVIFSRSAATWVFLPPPSIQLEKPSFTTS